MHVCEALRERRSTRGFLDTQVPREVLESIFQAAQRAPSNCNVQPWQVIVVSGETRDVLKQKLIASIPSSRPAPDFGASVIPAYQGVHQQRQHGAASALYTAMDISRDDKSARSRASLRNWAFFDAPHVALFTMERALGLMGAVDVGIYAQSLALLMTEQGISSCMQASLGYFPAPIREQLAIPESHGILFGMSFGYRDEQVPANRARTERAGLSEVVRFVG